MIDFDDIGLCRNAVKSGMEPWDLDQLFLLVASKLSPEVILEIGSRDFMDALRIKSQSPNSTVFAFEANPENYSEYVRNIDQPIFPLPIALGEKDEIGTIKVPKFASKGQSADIQQRGIGSILARDDLGESIDYKVPMLTLDTFMNNFAQDCRDFAMWIDVEGYALQVIKGASEQVLSRCKFIKVEVEEIAYWSGQHLASDVRSHMEGCGFFEVANCDKGLRQYDILFFNSQDV